MMMDGLTAIIQPHRAADKCSCCVGRSTRAHGERLITLVGSDRAKVLVALLLLSPHIPLLFMGEEFGESNPFLFFTDFRDDLANTVREGRRSEFDGHSVTKARLFPTPTIAPRSRRQNWIGARPKPRRGKIG